MNPIEKVERSELIVAKVVHGVEGVEEMVVGGKEGEGLCWSGERLVGEGWRGGCEWEG